MTQDPASPRPLTCPLCGSPVSPNTKFCESCGAKIDSSPRCSACGAPLSAGMKFCESCGAPAGGPGPSEPAVRPMPPPAQPVKPVVVPPPGPERSGKPRSRTGLVIGGVVVLVILAVVTYLVVLPMLSGTTNPPGTTAPAGMTAPIPIPGLATGIASASPTASPAATSRSTGSLVPLPTEQPPSELGVIIQVDKDAISGAITVMLVGGQGRLVVRECLVRVTHPDGSVVTGTILPAKKINEITLPGSKGTDRVEVLVTYQSGAQYRVIDKFMEYTRRVM